MKELLILILNGISCFYGIYHGKNICTTQKNIIENIYDWKYNIEQFESKLYVICDWKNNDFKINKFVINSTIINHQSYSDGEGGFIFSNYADEIDNQDNERSAKNSCNVDCNVFNFEELLYEYPMITDKIINTFDVKNNDEYMLPYEFYLDEDYKRRRPPFELDLDKIYFIDKKELERLFKYLEIIH